MTLRDRRSAPLAAAGRRTLVRGTVLGLIASTALAASPVALAAAGERTAKPSRTTTVTAVTTASTTTGWTTERLSSPARTEVRSSSGVLLATLTDGARTVVVNGPERVFSEPSTTTATVTTTSWVRLLPAPFTGTVDSAWLQQALADTSPDLLAQGMRYVTGAAQDASYGPLVDGARQEGADWNDHLGVTATYDGVADQPEASQLGAMDCSGFVRMLFGHLGGMPMVLRPDGVRVPRRAVQMATATPGATVVPDKGVKPTDLRALLPGDLVLFDAATDDGTDIDHVGVYVGKDAKGAPRFLSSRKKVDGPTIGDVGGRSTLTGTGYWATAFRQVHRL